MPSMIPNAQIFFRDFVDNIGALIRSNTGKIIRWSIPLSTVSTSIKAISVLSGYKIENQKSGFRVNYLDLIVKTSIASPGIAVEITGNSDND